MLNGVPKASAPPPKPKHNKGIHGVAAMIAGVLEIGIFHPFDTISKRLMSYQGRWIEGGPRNTLHNLNVVVFRQHAESALWRKFLYVYPGSTYAICYKVLQRTYKFAGQPIVREALQTSCGSTFDRAFGRCSKLATESLAGCFVGIGEVILLPLDRLKVLSQTNEAALRGQSAIRVLLREGRGMYAGTLVTMTRNAPGSFILFGGTALTKEVCFGLKDYRKASTLQNAVASSVGSILCVVFTSPMDVIKTRVQAKDLGQKHRGVAILVDLVRKEGFSAFFKGIGPKVIASSPRLAFAYTATEYFATLLTKFQKR